MPHHYVFYDPSKPFSIISGAVPKKILEVMKVPGLTRENIASHLQKYRIYLRKLEEATRVGLNGGSETQQHRFTRSVFGPVPNLRGGRPSVFKQVEKSSQQPYSSLPNPYSPMCISSINTLLSRFISGQQQRSDLRRTGGLLPSTSTPRGSPPPWNDGLTQSEPELSHLDFGFPQVGESTYTDGVIEGFDIMTSNHNAFQEFFAGAGLVDGDGLPSCNLEIDHGELGRILEIGERNQLSFPWDDDDDDDLHGLNGAITFTELIQSDSYPPPSSSVNARGGDDTLMDALRGFLDDPNLQQPQFLGDDGDPGDSSPPETAD